jgi:hypothetical protein
MESFRHTRLLTALRPFVLGAFPLMMPVEAHAATAPPWYPGINSVGHITFYNASGQVVRGGLSTDSLFALYAVASTDDYRSSDTKATVFAYTPVENWPQDAWTGAELTPSTNYPVLWIGLPPALGLPGVGAPAPLTTARQPVATSFPGDLTLGMYVAAYPNPQATGAYAGLYELRMRPSGPNLPVGAKYWNTVISVDTAAGTWSVYYP